MAVELKIPSVGESITEVEIGDWLVQEGDQVAEDDLLVVLESDKASMELPAPKAGTLKKILKQTGDTAEVGEVIGLLEAGDAPADDGSADEEAADEEAADEKPKEKKSKKAEEEPPGDEGEKDKKKKAKTEEAEKEEAKEEEPSQEEEASADDEPEDGKVMPAARRALADAGLKPSQVVATGPGGRLLKEDVLRHQKQADQEAATVPPKDPPKAPASASSPVPAGARSEEVVRMTSLRRRIAERLVGAQQDAALLTTFNEVDMSAVMALRSSYKEAFQERYGIKLGFMSFFIKAVIEGLKEVPALNAQIRDGSIVYHNYYDIGVAVGGGRGLVVPVIRNAERLSFAEVEKTINDLATRARDNKLDLEELQGGTFTISNGGIYGSMLSTPIVNPPQSGILGMHNIVERPVAVEGEVKIRPIMYVALTYDHRIVDGREAVTFLVRVKDCIERPARMLLEI